MMRAETVLSPLARLDSPQRNPLQEGHAVATPYPIVEGVEFKSVEGFPGYCVGDDGSVWSSRCRGKRLPFRVGPWRKLVQGSNTHGRPTVTLCSDAGHYTTVVHRIVAMAFLGPRPEGMSVCHNDGDKTNNRAANLRYDTHKANIADRDKHGATVRGDRHPVARLDKEKVRHVKRLLQQGVRVTHVANRFGVSRHTITNVRDGITWKWVT